MLYCVLCFVFCVLCIKQTNKQRMIATIHVIHIADRVDREPTMRALNEKLLQMQPVPIQIFTATRQSDGRKGCYESHVAVMKRALAINSEQHALIFEDDAEFASDMSTSRIQQLFNEALQFINKNKTLEILFLGSFPNIFVANDTVRIEKEGFQHIFKTNPATTHAYIASAPFMKRMTERFYEFHGVPIDDFYKSSLINTHAIYPSIFLQSSSESDIASPLASFVSKFKLKKFIWRLAEFYATSTSISLKHVLFVSSILLVLIYQLSSFSSSISCPGSLPLPPR